MKEEWRPILNGVFEIERSGTIRRRAKGSGTYVGRVQKIHKDKRGYCRVKLHHDGKGLNLLVHRLVAEAFIGPCPNGLTVDHKDANKSNNCPENLEYVTGKENSRRAAAAGLMDRGADNGASKLNDQKVRAIYAAFKGGKTGMALALEYGVAESTILRIGRGETWRHLSLTSPAPHTAQDKPGDATDGGTGPRYSTEQQIRNERREDGK